MPGLHFYDNDVAESAMGCDPLRGALEVTDPNQIHLQQGRLQVSLLDRATAWLEIGTFDSLNDVSTFVCPEHDRQGPQDRPSGSGWPGSRVPG